MKKIIPILITVWALFIIAVYCRSFIIPRVIEFISR